MSTHVYRVRGSKHDASYKSSLPTAWSYTGTTLPIDLANTAYVQTPCAVPIGATVTSATLRIYPTADVVGIITGGVSALVGADDYTADLTTSVADAVAIDSGTWSTSAWATTGVDIDIVDLVQTFIARADYMPGDLLTVSITDPDGVAGRAIYSFGHSPSSAATITVVFTPAAGLAFAANALTAMAKFSERLVYVPLVGSRRTINGIVDRQDAGDAEGFDGTTIIPVTATVANDQETGIASWELLHGDRIKVSARLGGVAMERLIAAVRLQDQGVVELSLA